MHPLANLARGIYLPYRNIWVEWGARFDALSPTASQAESRAPAYQVRGNGNLLWKNEMLLPYKPDEKPRLNLEGNVRGAAWGDPLTIRSFTLEIFDTGFFRQEVFQYYLWMTRLSFHFGEPTIPTWGLKHGTQIVPTCNWRIDAVTISLSYTFGWSDPNLAVCIRHDAYPLPSDPRPG
jgi:hypothetical protein